MKIIDDGDKVLLRKDLEVGENYSGFRFNGSMIKGEFVTCVDVATSTFMIEEDGENWIYSYDMVDWDEMKKIELDKVVRSHVKYTDDLNRLLECGSSFDEVMDIFVKVGKKH